MSVELPPLPLEQWRATKDTLHLWAQIIGKVRLAHMPKRNHSWHASLSVSLQGLTTGRIPVGGSSLQIDLDLQHDELVLATPDGDAGVVLFDGLSVADVYREIMDALQGLGVPTQIRATPYGVPMTTPFAEDDEHRSYDRDAARRFHRVLTFADTALQTFAGWFTGKSSPVQVFWHSFDLAHSRFVRRSDGGEDEIAFGFWPGDDITPEPTFYSYTTPGPDGIAEQSLRPDAAHWFAQASGATAHLSYEAVRPSPDPLGAVLAFFHSAYEAGASLRGWDMAGMAAPWAALPLAAAGERSGDGQPV